MLELEVTGGLEKEVMFNVWAEGKNAGALRMSREYFTRFADKIFGKNYKLTQANEHPKIQKGDVVESK